MSGQSGPKDLIKIKSGSRHQLIGFWRTPINWQHKQILLHFTICSCCVHLVTVQLQAPGSTGVKVTTEASAGRRERWEHLRRRLRRKRRLRRRRRRRRRRLLLLLLAADQLPANISTLYCPLYCTLGRSPSICTWPSQRSKFMTEKIDDSRFSGVFHNFFRKIRPIDRRIPSSKMIYDRIILWNYVFTSLFVSITKYVCAAN